MRRLRAAIILLLLMPALVVVGCGKRAEEGIVVGSTTEVESRVLAQIVIAVLDENGYDVVDGTNAGSADTVRAALLAGDIDMYVEYTGRAFSTFFSDASLDPGIARDAGRLHATVKQLDGERNDVVWLGRAPASAAWGIAIPFGLAEEFQMGSLEDWALWLAEGNVAKLACTQGFADSADGLTAFESAYGFDLGGEELLIVDGGTGEAMTAVAQEVDGANAAAVYRTDGSIAALDLWVLDDPLAAQPYNQPAPIVRKAVLDASGDLAAVLDPVFAKLDVLTLQELSKQVSIDGLDPAVVAREYLTEQGVID